MSPVSDTAQSQSSFSLLFTVTKGISANMLKISSKRRRTLAQIKADKEAAAQKEADTAAKLSQYEAMHQRLEQLELESKNGNAAASLMS